VAVCRAFVAQRRRGIRIFRRRPAAAPGQAATRCSSRWSVRRRGQAAPLASGSRSPA
jgi:hypothetical protein